MRFKKTLALLLTATTIFAMTGCGSSAASDNADASTDTTAADNADTGADTTAADTTDASADAVAEDLAGSIQIAGSTSMEKVANALMEAFMEQYPNVTVNVEFNGSGAGIEAVNAGTVDIGDSSRALKDEEKQAGAVENIIAIDGIAVITNTTNQVINLTADDLKNVYTGEVTNWSELGGQDEAIVVVGRENGSGTRGAFEELLDITDACAYAQELDSTGAVLATVASTPGAIGYVSLDVVDDTVTSMTIDDVAATEENIVAGSYLLSRPFVMATKGEISEQNDLVKAWFAFIDSEAGQEVIKGVGLILPQ